MNSISRLKLVQALTAVGLVVLACGMNSSSRATAQEASATAEAPARIAVKIPHAESGRLVLDIVVTAFQKPETGNIGGLVRLKRASDGKIVEIGRFSVLASKSFKAASADEERRFQFDVTEAWKQLELYGANAPAEIEVEVALVDRTNGKIKVPASAKLVVGNANFATR